MREVIKILLVDDEATVRHGLRMRIGLEPDLAIVGEAGDGLEALKRAQALHPDVVVMDVEMPDMDGLTATKKLSEVAPLASVVMLSIHDDALIRAQSYATGAVAFVGKQEDFAYLLDAIRRAADKGDVET